MIKQLDGTVCEDAAAAMGRWRQHFGGLEAGLECKASDLAIAAANRIPTEWPLPESLQHMPDITDLQRVLSASKPHKATGPDGLPAELGKIFPIEVADILFPLLLKFALRGEEAVGHKSGQAIFFWKGKGSQQECSSYRAILLLSAWAKAVHQTLRPRALHVYHASAPPLQLGSRPGSNVVYGSHLVRAYQRWAASIGNTGFVLFADIASAYYSAVRELVATKPGTDGESIPDEALANLKLSADDLERLKAHAQEPSAFRQAGADPWTEAISHCMTDGTFFMLRGDTVAMATNRGTRPGSSWADILFATVMQRVLQRRNELRQGLLYPSSAPKVPWDGQRTLTPCSSDAGEIEIDDAVWADDLATMRVCTDPTTAPTAIGLEVGCLVDSFREHGFALSFGSRKTAILASPAGAGSRKLRQRLFGAHAGQGKLEVLLEGEGAAKVPLVSHYKHLGAMQGPKGSLGAEITYRTSQAFAAYSEGRRKVYRCRVIPVGRKALILRTAVIPKLTFGCGSWPPLTAGEYKKFSGCLWRMYRSLLCLRHDQEQDLSFHACLSLVELPSPRDTLRMHRLLYIGQMIRGGPDALWALLRTDSAYTATALEAFRWLHCLVGPPAGLPEPDRDWGPWAELMSKKPGHFKGLVKRAVLLEQHRHTVIAALDGLHRGLSAYGTGNRPTFQLSQCQDVCIPCRKAFGSRVSWSGHAARCHGYRSQAFLLGVGKTCEGCGKTYSSPGRLKRHLVTAFRCRAEWGSFVPDQPPPESTHEQAPPCVVAGVRRVPPVPCPSDAVCQPLLTALLAMEEDSSDLGWQLVEEHIAPFETLRHTVTCWTTHAAAQTWAPSVGEDLLLLLDPALICDSVQQVPPSRACPADVVPSWQCPSPMAFVSSGAPRAFTIPDPPPRLWLPSSTEILTVRQASEFADWLEGACRAIAEAVSISQSQPFTISCPRFRSSIGPAASWLEACGFVVQASHMYSP